MMVIWASPHVFASIALLDKLSAQSCAAVFGIHGLHQDLVASEVIFLCRDDIGRDAIQNTLLCEMGPRVVWVWAAERALLDEGDNGASVGVSNSCEHAGWRAEVFWLTERQHVFSVFPHGLLTVRKQFTDSLRKALELILCACCLFVLYVMKVILTNALPIVASSLLEYSFTLDKNPLDVGGVQEGKIGHFKTRSSVSL